MTGTDCAFWPDKVIEPFFFENAIEDTVTINVIYVREMRASNILWLQIAEVEIKDVCI